MQQAKMTAEEQKARAFWGADYERVMAERERTSTKTMTANCFSCGQKIVLKKKESETTWSKFNSDGSVHYDERKQYRGRNWGTCWECGCEGNLDRDGYCGC